MKLSELKKAYNKVSNLISFPNFIKNHFNMNMVILENGKEYKSFSDLRKGGLI